MRASERASTLLCRQFSGLFNGNTQRLFYELAATRRNRPIQGRYRSGCQRPIHVAWSYDFWRHRSVNARQKARPHSYTQFWFQGKYMLAMSDALFMRRACPRVSRIAGSQMDPVHVMWIGEEQPHNCSTFQGCARPEKHRYYAGNDRFDFGTALALALRF
jgi:hypothetical protein